ncbi:conserved protein of unknown function(Uncharacterised conserved protein UCP020408,314-408) [Magnetospirillum sp. XM-1]|uniref:DUF2325 domain-containing protein n=1 Tax=Magnetospirillum sp. XM-1 TaxID=1663591 RepID=UPI00073DDB12|nr:DUF2325 domain-containing protein [Magnetospirillum sp. XM-1]CUW38685.1 conserved protein of unknown function(Uncharacterised conserved protein UCP020408,314-408) [Magnetospirillum sp. XM-1]
MCEQCHPALAAPVDTTRRRARLWEIDSQWHCTVIGTCLSLGELKGAATRLKVQMRSAKPSPYEIHTGMIHLASRERLVGKALTKMLDRKHAAAINRAKPLDGEDALAELWEEALAKGDVASACWAVMSHPDATDGLRSRIFGDIHMLSHQVGAAARADLKSIHQLEREKAELEAKVARQQERMKTEIGRRNTEIRELRQLLDQEASESRRLAHAASAAREMEQLQRELGELRHLLEVETAFRQVAEDESRRLQAQARDREQETERLERELRDMQGELAASEARLAETLSPPSAAADGLGQCDEDCARLDLCGRCILFVGGRNQHLPHFRRLVEEAGGTFAHHDGGFEESMGRLHSLFGRADAVLFPVDSVSHSAHDEVKRLCRRWEKPFVPVRRSGLGAFIRALNTVAGAP